MNWILHTASAMPFRQPNKLASVAGLPERSSSGITGVV
jgi:hypothetical protein